MRRKGKNDEQAGSRSVALNKDRSGLRNNKTEVKVQRKGTTRKSARQKWPKS